VSVSVSALLSACMSHKRKCLCLCLCLCLRLCPVSVSVSMVVKVRVCAKESVSVWAGGTIEWMWKMKS